MVRKKRSRRKSVDRVKLSLLCNIAEDLVKSLVEQDSNARRVFSKAFECSGRSFTILPKQKLCGAYLDAEHALDLCIVFDDGVIFPIEVKAGQNVPTIKTNPRMFGAGNMLAILDGQVNHISREQLYVQVGASELKLSNPGWGLVARDCITPGLRKKLKSKPPPLILSLESLCQSVDSEKFNDIVGKILHSQNYFDDWFPDCPRKDSNQNGQTNYPNSSE